MLLLGHQLNTDKEWRNLGGFVLKFSDDENSILNSVVRWLDDDDKDDDACCGAYGGGDVDDGTFDASARCDDDHRDHQD